MGTAVSDSPRVLVRLEVNGPVRSYVNGQLLHQPSKVNLATLGLIAVIKGRQPRPYHEKVTLTIRRFVATVWGDDGDEFFADSADEDFAGRNRKRVHGLMNRIRGQFFPPEARDFFTLEGNNVTLYFRRRQFPGVRVETDEAEFLALRRRENSGERSLSFLVVGSTVARKQRLGSEVADQIKEMRSELYDDLNEVLKALLPASTSDQRALWLHEHLKEGLPDVILDELGLAGDEPLPDDLFAKPESRRVPRARAAGEKQSSEPEPSRGRATFEIEEQLAAIESEEAPRVSSASSPKMVSRERKPFRSPDEKRSSLDPRDLELTE